MKNMILFAIIALSGSVFANTHLTFNLDDVDTIITNDHQIIIEDIRDGFENVRGVNVTNDSISVSTDSNIQILFRNGYRHVMNNNPSNINRMMPGGDGGGG